MPSGLPRFHLFIHLSEEVACDSHDGQVIAARLVALITAVPGNGGDSCPELMPAVKENGLRQRIIREKGDERAWK